MLDNDIFEFDYKMITPLLAYSIQRNRAIGTSLFSGITKDLFQIYINFGRDESYYLHVLTVARLNKQQQILAVKKLIEEANAEEDLTVKKSKLLNVLELVQELKLELDYG